MAKVFEDNTVEYISVLTQLSRVTEPDTDLYKSTINKLKELVDSIEVK